MNICIFAGRLTRDAECRYTTSGKAVANFGLAVDSGYGDKKTTTFINCVLWEKDKLAPHLTKGKPVMVQGEYTERKWQDQQGQERRRVEIVVRNIDFQQGQSQGQGTTQKGHVQDNKHFPADASGIEDVPFG